MAKKKHPKTIYVLRVFDGGPKVDQYWGVYAEPGDCLDDDPNRPLLVGEYRLVRLLKVSAGNARIEEVQKCKSK